MRAMILAAGRGERMRPLTDHLPKPLLQAGGKPLIQYHLERVARLGIRDVVINLAWKGAEIRSALGDGSQFGLRIAYSDEGDSALETGGGIHHALPLLGDAPFLVMNGDVWTDWPGVASLRGLLATSDQAHLILVPNPVQHPGGDFSLRNGRVTTDQDVRHTFSGIALYRPEFFFHCSSGAFKLLPLLLGGIHQGLIGGSLYEGRWFDIGTPQRLAALDADLSARSNHSNT
jgi:MurNAc alpha-1-phosphate uridylyltransferase